jgi:ferric-dicitrate binding protein FerR (iron transport regulator)
MIQNPEHQLTVLYNDQQLAELFEALDQLHSAASEGRLSAETTLNEREMVAWLQELIYTAQQTIDEIEANQPRHARVFLRLLEKSPSDQRPA